MKKKVIFTDLDGTLLDSKYSFKSALKALKALKQQEIPLIISTSKTRAEIEVYRRKLDNNEPFISENGGAIFIPLDYFEFPVKGKRKGKYKVKELGMPYKKLIKALDKIDKKIDVRGFHEMSAKQLAKESGLSLKEAKLAKKREYDEAFKLVEEKEKTKLIRMIEKLGLNYTIGGRYMHILGDNDKGRAVRILTELYRKKYGKILTIGLGDSENDREMLEVTEKAFWVSGPKDWNEKIIGLLKLNVKMVREGEKLYRESVKILKNFQLSNGAILASSPKGRYPYVYPRDHAVCILGLIDAGLMKQAKKALNFIFKGQNKDGSFPQRLTKRGQDASYKPIQLDNTGLILYAFSKYVQASGDYRFLIGKKKKIMKAISYMKKNLHKKNLFFTPNSIHEFPPLEKGLEIWANATCFGALEELGRIGIKHNIKLDKIKKAIEKYFWNGKYFIKTIRLKESSSVASSIDASSYSLADYGVFEDRNDKIEEAVKVIERELWHPKLGGICRYKKHIGRNNGGWGPWPHFTLMIARHYIRLGKKEKADKYIKWILKIAYNNLLPEHIATKQDFKSWIRQYRKAGILRKDREIMIQNIRKSKMYKKGLAYSVLPLTWPHAEFIRTWKLYKEKFV